MLTINIFLFILNTVNRFFKKQIPVLLTVCTELSTGITFNPVLLYSLSTLFKGSNHKIGLYYHAIPGMVIDIANPAIKNMTKKRVYLFLSE